MSQDTQPPKEGKHTFGWIFGVLFLLGGLGMFTESFISGFSVLAVGSLLLPPSRKWLEGKMNKPLSSPVLIIASVILFAVAGAAMPGSTSNTESVASESDAPSTASDNVEVTTEEDTTTKDTIQEEAPKEQSMLDKLWIAFDNSIKHRSGYDVSWSDTSKAVTVTKVEDSFWDENDIVRKDYADLVQYGKEAFKIEGVDQVQVVYKTEFTDQYGKKETETAVEIWFNKDEFQKYEWDNLSFQPVWRQMEDGSAYYYIHPAINKGITKDKLYLAL